MYKHKRNVHLNINYFECEVCKEPFENSRESYEKHSQTHAKSERPKAKIDKRKEL